MQDSVTGNINFQMRDYNPRTFTWNTQDPLGYVNGPDMYQFVGDNPINRFDPSGLQTTTIGLPCVLKAMKAFRSANVLATSQFEGDMDYYVAAHYQIAAANTESELYKGIIFTVGTAGAGEIIEGVAELAFAAKVESAEEGLAAAVEAANAGEAATSVINAAAAELAVARGGAKCRKNDCWLARSGNFAWNSRKGSFFG